MEMDALRYFCMQFGGTVKPLPLPMPVDMRTAGKVLRFSGIYTWSQDLGKLSLSTASHMAVHFS